MTGQLSSLINHDHLYSRDSSILVCVYTCWLLHSYDYRIALIFRGSKFSQIAVFDNFVEKNSRIRCRSRRWCEVSKFSLQCFRKWHLIHENRENLDPRNISAIRYYQTIARSCDIQCSVQNLWAVSFHSGPSNSLAMEVCASLTCNITS